MALESSLSPASASVVFLKIPDYAALTVTRQAALHEQLLSVVTAAVRAWATEDRVVLDAPDGLAIVGLASPERALEAAELARDATGDAALNIGLHHGPVRAVLESSGATRVVGDGVDAAAAIAGFAAQRQILVSSAFRDALSVQSPQKAQALMPAGTFTDDRLRAHELFRFDPQVSRVRSRRFAMIGGAAVAGILGLGYATRLTLQAIEAARKPAVVRLEIKPWGLVAVDGEVRGTSPPLDRLSISPGAHTIEIRNPRFKTWTLEVELKPGEEMQLKHVFVGAPARKPGLLERFKFW
jgi:class 3 adenylate cyclase